MKCLRFFIAICLVGLGLPQASAGPEPAPQHYIFSIDEDMLAGLPDQSALNQPLNASARLFVRDAHFHRVGADLRPGTDDDERVRLFGISLSFNANFPSADQALLLAKRLRRLGINAVRLHHLDTMPGTQSDPPSSLLLSGEYPSFNPNAVARLKALIQALSREGIYVNLNLRVGYPFGPKDGIPSFNRSQMARPNATPIAVYHPTLVALQERYARETIALLDLQDNPALAMVEISNEASLLAAWQRREWTDAIPERYRETLRDLWRNWLTARYGSATNACQAWGKCLASDAHPDLPSPADTFSIRRNIETLRSQISLRLPKLLGGLIAQDKVIETPGDRESRRIRDFLTFLADTDQAYFEHLRNAVQDAARFAVPTTGTQTSYGGILNLSAQAGMDYIDDHTYVSHPDFPNGFGDPRNWRIWNDSLTNKEMDTKLLALAFRRDASKPFVLSEFNHPFPGVQGAEIIPITAIVASLQDWDGIFFFDYANGSTWSTAPSGFALRGDWGKYVLASQSAWLYRTGQVRPLSVHLNIPMNLAAQLALATSPAKDALEQHIEHHYGITPALAWTHAIAVETRPGPVPLALRQPPAPPYTSPDGSVTFDPQRQLLTLSSPMALGLFGQPVKAPMEQGLTVTPSNVSPQYVSILLTSSDRRPIGESSRLLLTLGSQTVGTQPGSKPPRPKRQILHPSGKGSWTLEPDPLHDGAPSGSRYAEPPAWLAKSPLSISWQTDTSRSIKIYPLDGTGGRMQALPSRRIHRENGRVTLDLQTTPAETSPWYEVEIDIGRP